MLESGLPATQSGQTATQLPDGRWLLAGGLSSDKLPTVEAKLLDPKTGKAVVLTTRLAQVRSGHTATALPDGSVLILGGLDASANAVTTVEQFDPATTSFKSLGDLGVMARSGHTATILADGRLLIVGGQDARGRTVYDAELYNPRTRQVERFNAKLNTSRLNHLAALLPGADVLIWGGIDSAQQWLNQGELFDAANQRFRPLTSGAAADLARTLAGNGQPAIKDTRPAAEERAAPIDQPLVVRFNQRMAVSSLNTNTVTLIGPHGPVAIKPVALENGLLLFITPQQDLLPATRYTLFIKDATDQTGQLLPFASIGFTTMQLSGQSAKGAATSIITSSSASNAGVTSLGSVPAVATQPKYQSNIAKAEKVLGATEQKAIDAAKDNTDAEVWQPNASNMKGDWRAKRSPSPLQDLPSLQAPEGETALAGQVLTMNGRGLANVTLAIGKQTAQTDETGRFLLRQLSPGAQVLSVDGSSANQKGNRYGFYQVKVDIEEKRTTALGYTMWSPQLDSAGDIKLSSPTTQDTVLTSPRIPGLELRIPAGTVVRDHNGKIITEINMTAIPTDRPPFPIPGVGVPIYFTIQPGGATLTNVNGRAQQGAQLIYPNFSGAAPASRIDFWNYDARGKGWYIYGQGTVSADGKQVVPDAGVAIYEFTGAMVSLPSNAPSFGPPPKGCLFGDPVDCFTGLFKNDATDLTINDVLPLEVHRSYRQSDPTSRAFGIGTNLSYDIFLIGDTRPYTYQDLILPDGGRIHYVRTSPGTSFSDAVYTHTFTDTKYYGSTIRRGGANCYWQLDQKDGTRFCFADSDSSGNPRAAAALSINDRYGNILTFTRDGNGNLTRIVSPSGRYIQFIYDGGNRITSATDNIGRKVLYAYDTSGRLVKVTDPTGQFEAFTYDAAHNMLTVQDKRANMMVTNVYDTNNRVSKQTYADGSTNLFTYLTDASGKVTQTDITNERGFVTRMAFNASGYPLQVTKALSKPEQQVFTFVRDPATNLVQSQTDALGRKTTYTYDARGNQLTQTLLAGTAQAVTATKTYTADFNQVASIKDYLGNQVTLTYDSKGNAVSVQDPNGNRVSRTYNAAGQLLTMTNALAKTTSLIYEGPDLAKVTDPLNRSIQRFTDAAGRTLSQTNALGNRTVYDIDALDRLTLATDPLDQSITNAFDGNDNNTQVRDAKGNLHQFAYDKRNALISQTDPLLKGETYAYDAGHNLIRKTDRKGQITQYAYDGLDRLTTITYADASMVTMTYDQGNRVIQIVDSVNGTITRTYDSLDRITRQTTPKGSIDYTYYANGLRKTMTVSGQPTLTYTYDAGNRLTIIDQAAGAANNNLARRISFTYDANNRRLQTMYTNGIRRTNGYDDAGQLISIVYNKADGTVLGDLRYTYDNGGRRIKTSGSLARTTLPADIATTSVDAANRLITAGAQSFIYDANGNLTSDGSQTYVWNARNQLSQIKNSSGAVLSSFTYDALGRRQTKTVNGVGSGYVYDGANIVQELARTSVDNSVAANVRATYISGGIDEVFTQLSGANATSKMTTYLTDALGSVIQLTDQLGGKVVDYTYGPYGETTADATVSNPFQYTGRENDGNGLYYYRARYYSPGMGRFIASDPIGLAGGINTYTYVGGNPISRTDPSGLMAGLILPGSPGGNLMNMIICGLIPNWFASGDSGGGGTGSGGSGTGGGGGGSNGGNGTPTSPADILAPGGVPVGENIVGAKPGVQTVSPDNLTDIIDRLKGGGATVDPTSRYPGEWYNLPNGEGGFGVRDSRDNGRTLDVNIPGVPDVTKVHQQ